MSSIDSISSSKNANLMSPNLGGILIDMQFSYLRGIPNKNVKNIISNQKKIIRAFATYDIPLAVLEYRDKGPTINELRGAVEEVPRFKYFMKLYHDGFTLNSLELFLLQHEVSSLIIMGVFAEYCVKQTSKSAVELGFRVNTASDLIAGPDFPSPQTVTWYEQNTIYAQSTDTLLADLIK